MASMERPASSEVLKKLQREETRIFYLISNTKSGIKSLSFMLNFINGTIPVYMVRGSGHRQQMCRIICCYQHLGSQSFHPHPVNSSMVKRANRRWSSVPWLMNYYFLVSCIEIPINVCSSLQVQKILSIKHTGMNLQLPHALIVRSSVSAVAECSMELHLFLIWVLLTMDQELLCIILQMLILDRD